MSEETQIKYASACYSQFKAVINELYRQLEAHKSQPPKIVFKANSKFSQFIAPLLAGNSKTWLMGTIKKETSHNTVSTILDTLIKFFKSLFNRAKKIVVPVVKVTGLSRKDLGLTRIRKDDVKESNDSLKFMEIFGSAKDNKEVRPIETPSTIKKQLQDSVDVFLYHNLEFS